MKRRIGLIFLCFALLIPYFQMPAFAETEYAWVLVDVTHFDLPASYKPLAAFDGTDNYFASLSGNTVEIRGYNPKTFFKQLMDLHARYYWTEPPKVIRANETVNFRLYQTVFSYLFGGLGVGYSPSITADTADLTLGYATASKRVATGFYEDGQPTKKLLLAENGDPSFQKSTYADLSLTFFDEAKVGTKRAIYMSVYGGSPGSIGSRYTYEWKALTGNETMDQYGATIFESGIRLQWHPSDSLGYRIFRSTSPDTLGISVTDFYIETSSYVDVNVEPNKQYYYTIKPVITEANPLNNVEEVLGEPIGYYTAKTSDAVSSTSVSKSVIVLQLNNPNLSVNGILQEVDPGRGTKPMYLNGRVMIPIAAMVEAMGGEIKWDGITKKVTIEARGITLELWLNKKEIMVNGVKSMMDVAPGTFNGRTFVPVSFVASNLKAKTAWINSTKEAIVIFE